MSHRVIQFDSKVVDFTTADAMQDDIKNELDNATAIENSSYDLHTREVNDGEDLDGNATLAIKTDHNDDTGANKFFDWIRNYVKSNSRNFDSARLRIHDCQHLESITQKEDDLHNRIVNSYPDLDQEMVDQMFTGYEFSGVDLDKGCEIGNSWEL